jgi:hypothetical protein
MAAMRWMQRWQPALFKLLLNQRQPALAGTVSAFMHQQTAQTLLR